MRRRKGGVRGPGTWSAFMSLCRLPQTGGRFDSSDGTGLRLSLHPVARRAGMSRSRVALCLVLTATLSALAGCNRVDPDSPEYWEKTLSRTRRVADEVRVVEAMRSSGHVSKAFLPMLHERLAEAK